MDHTFIRGQRQRQRKHAQVWTKCEGGYCAGAECVSRWLRQESSTVCVAAGLNRP